MAPTPTRRYIKEAYQEWKSGKSGKGLIATIKDKMAEFKTVQQARSDSEEYALTGIQVRGDNDPKLGRKSVAGSSRDVGKIPKNAVAPA